jgi:hypothetical protein
VTSRLARYRTEWLCIRECLRFARRHRRYLIIFLGLYAGSLRGWRRARAARYGYCFLQLFDDIMDGDRPSTSSRDDVATRTIAEWEQGLFAGDDTLGTLGAAFAEALMDVPLQPGDDPGRNVRALLHAMHGDARRVASGRMLSADEIASQLRGTFHHSLDVLLITAGHRTRASQVPHLVECMGWCSVVRDLADDLRKGLVNIPADVVTRVRSRGDALSATHPEVLRWLEDYRRAVLPHVTASAAILRDIGRVDPGAGRLLGMFQRSVERYAR